MADTRRGRASPGRELPGRELPGRELNVSVQSVPGRFQSLALNVVMPSTRLLDPPYRQPGIVDRREPSGSRVRHPKGSGEGGECLHGFEVQLLEGSPRSIRADQYAKAVAFP